MWCDVMRCGCGGDECEVVWCDEVWCGVMRCGVV